MNVGEIPGALVCDSTTDHSMISCHRCPLCNATFESDVFLDRHLEKDHESDTTAHSHITDSMTEKGSSKRVFASYRYCCKLCPRTFGSSSVLNVHYTHTHRDKPQYECEVCGRCFAVKRELATHRRLHDGQPTHRCDQCQKEFGTKQLLRKHELWHTGERAHVCPHCQKAFFQKGHLTQHLMIHSGGRNHACHLCPKTFIFKFDLNRHMKIHAERVHCSSSGRGSSESPAAMRSASPVLTEGRQVIESPDLDFSRAEAVPGALSSIFATSTSDEMISKLAALKNFHLLGWQHLLAVTAPFVNNSNLVAQRSMAEHALLGLTRPALFSDTAENRNMLSSHRDSHDSQSASSSSAAAISPATDYTVGNLVETGDTLLRQRSVSAHHSDTLAGAATNKVVAERCTTCCDCRARLATSERKVDELESLLGRRHVEMEHLRCQLLQVARLADRLSKTCHSYEQKWRQSDNLIQQLTAQVNQ